MFFFCDRKGHKLFWSHEEKEVELYLEGYSKPLLFKPSSGKSKKRDILRGTVVSETGNPNVRNKSAGSKLPFKKKCWQNL